MDDDPFTNAAESATGELALDRLLLLVVGAHPQAEADDRLLAYQLRRRILDWQEQWKRRAGAENGNGLLQPLVCTDLWYLNDAMLRQRPVIALGDPAVNAATAYLSSRLPTAFVIEHTLRVQLDPEFIELQACLWGKTAQATSSAIDLFAERYLDDFLTEALEKS